MKLLFFIGVSLAHADHIKNINLPSCKNCIHNSPHFYTLGGYSPELSECKYFGKKNVVTNEIKYDYAYNCRDDENKCGIDGKYFEKNSNIQLKVFLYHIKNTSPFYFFLLMCLFSSILKLPK